MTDMTVALINISALYYGFRKMKEYFYIFELKRPYKLEWFCFETGLYILNFKYMYQPINQFKKKINFQTGWMILH